MQVCLKNHKADLGRSDVQVDLVFLLDGDEICAFIGPNAHDEKFWYMRKVRQDEFLKAGYTFLRSVKCQDRPLESQAL